MLTALFVAIGYLFGSLPFGYWLPRVLKGLDIRRLGSGNIGATNVWRVLGRRYGVPVVLLDVAKGFVPTLLATIFVGHLAGALTGGLVRVRVRSRREHRQQDDGDEVAEGGRRPVNVSCAVEPGGVDEEHDAGNKGDRTAAARRPRHLGRGHCLACS